MKLYDTLTGKKKAFKPLRAKRVDLFVCGPTVYDYSHVGHARTYVVFDAFTKYLRSLGYQVSYIQNITDVDDKIIARASTLSQTPESLARMYEEEYYRDMETLDVHSVTKYARATDYVPQIISQVKRLLRGGYAYEIEQEGIYYDISKFPDYGKLARRSVEQAEDSVSRIDESTQKKNKGDFALWKFSKEGEPKWQSPWGTGRPGWHIEDTAITETELGEQYDIHGGARDLIFPHHEAEIAQMEAISGKKPLVNYWMHTGFLTIHGQKMSKSLGNFITIHEFLKKYSKETLRLFALSSHYRSPIDYTEEVVQQAETNAKRFEEFYEKITQLSEASEGKKSDFNNKKSDFGEFARDFERHLADDFNTPKALAALFDLVRDGNSRIAQNKLDSREATQILKFLEEVNTIFSIIPKVEHETIPQNILELVHKREQSRKKGDWAEADKLRIAIESMGYMIKDTPKGPEVKK